MTAETTVTRYEIEFRRPGSDVWESAEPHLLAEEQYVATREEAESGIREYHGGNGTGDDVAEMRVRAVTFDAAEWAAMIS